MVYFMENPTNMDDLGVAQNGWKAPKETSEVVDLIVIDPVRSQRGSFFGPIQQLDVMN